jgi:hypothetical protein
MNIFEVAIFSSAIAGVAGGITAAPASAWSTIVCAGVGLLAGVLVYAAAMAPGIVLLKFAPNKGLTPSKMASAGAALVFAGAVGSPFVAYFSTVILFAVAVA